MGRKQSLIIKTLWCVGNHIQIMKEIKTHWDSYGVFAIAIQLQTHDYGFIDGLWQDAIDLYQRFYYSSYNDANKSELECINEYMADINKQLNNNLV